MNFKLSEIIARLGGVLVGEDIAVHRVSSVANAQAGHVSFLTESKYRAALATTKASAIILSAENQHLTELPRIVTDNPYAYFAKVSALLNPTSEVTRELPLVQSFILQRKYLLVVVLDRML